MRMGRKDEKPGGEVVLQPEKDAVFGGGSLYRHLPVFRLGKVHPEVEKKRKKGLRRAWKLIILRRIR